MEGKTFLTPEAMPGVNYPPFDFCTAGFCMCTVLLSIKDLQDVVNRTAPTYYPAKDIKTLLSQLYDRAVAQGAVQTNIAK